MKRSLNKFVPTLCSAVTVVMVLSVTGCGGAAPAAVAPKVASCPLVSGSQMVASTDQTNATAGSSVESPRGSARLKRLTGHVLAAVTSSTDQGKLDETRELPLTISLAPVNESQLAREVSDIYRPGSAKFHQFLTSAEFRARYAPSESQVAGVTAFLARQGLHSISSDANGLFVHAVGSVKNINAAFSTEIHRYSDAKGRAFHAPGQELRVPAGLPIQGVHGLQSLSVAHTHLKGPDSPQTSVRAAGSGPSGGFSPSDIRKAYNLPDNLDGSGQTLALFELDGFNNSDITAFEQQYGLPATPLRTILVDGATGSAGSGQDEVNLDIELMVAFAPKATNILVYEGPNTDQGMLDTFSKIASDNLAKSVSTSWGASEGSLTSSFMQAENTIFTEMAAQGQTIYSASGDSGANDNGSSLSVDDPSAQPFVVGVGGTSLTLGSGGARASESSWNDSSGGGGGGISTVWTIPNWQKGMISSSSKGSTSMRNVPDVAFNSDIQTGYSIYSRGSWNTWGGTSCAAPIWAAFNALVDQQRATNGLGPLGYVTPTLYAIGSASHYTADFFDIADGSTNGFYPAVTGYDDATGWGSFNATSLLADLSQDVQTPAPAPTPSSTATTTPTPNPTSPGTTTGTGTATGITPTVATGSACTP